MVAGCPRRSGPGGRGCGLRRLVLAAARRPAEGDGRRKVAPDSDNAEDLPRQLASATSASILSTSTPMASSAQLVGFHCLACGYLLRAENRHPSPAPMCAGSKARTGKQHESTLMQPLFLH